MVKNDHFQTTKKPTSSVSTKIFDPQKERTWSEFLEKVKVSELVDSAVYKLRKHVEQMDDSSEEDEEIGDDFENLYKGEISKSGVPILPSKRARKIPEKIQVSKDDLAELTNTPEVQAEESETGEVSLDQMSEEENNEAATEDSETSNS